MSKRIALLLVIAGFFMHAAITHATPVAKNTAYFELRVYHYKDAAQEASLDSFLQYQYLPFLHRARLKNIGVFKAIANDTAADKKIYVFTSFSSLRQWEDFSAKAVAPAIAGETGYVNAAYTRPAFTRIEQILIKAFPLMQPVAPSKLTGPRSERVYELRSYEGPSEKYFRNKVKMFNEGGEISLFERLGFNAVFYGEVLFGSRMPNLMYMTSFDNMRSREDHWKAFISDPEWKTLSAKPEYQHTVSHIDITFLRPVEYSDL